MFKLFSITEQTISVFYKLCAKLTANLLKSKQTYRKPEFPPAHNEQTNRKLQANCLTGSGPGLAAAGVSQALLCAGTGREGDRETPRCRHRRRSYCRREGSRRRGTARGGLSSCQHRSSGQGLAVGWAEHREGAHCSHLLCAVLSLHSAAHSVISFVALMALLSLCSCRPDRRIWQ